MKQKTMYAKRSTIGTVVLNVLLISVFLFSSCNEGQIDLSPPIINLDIIGIFNTEYTNKTEYTIHITKFNNGDSEAFNIDPKSTIRFGFVFEGIQKCTQSNISKPEITNPSDCLIRLSDSLLITFDNDRELIWRKNDMENDLNLLNNEKTQRLRMIVDENRNVGFYHSYKFEFTEALYEQATPINQQ